MLVVIILVFRCCFDDLKNILEYGEILDCIKFRISEERIFYVECYGNMRDV